MVNHEQSEILGDALHCRPFCKVLGDTTPDYCTSRRLACGGCEKCLRLERDGTPVTSLRAALGQPTPGADLPWTKITFLAVATIAGLGYLLRAQLARMAKLRKYKCPPGFEKMPLPSAAEMGAIRAKPRAAPAAPQPEPEVAESEVPGDAEGSSDEEEIPVRRPPPLKNKKVDDSQLD